LKLVVADSTPTVGISHVTSNVRVAGGKENAFGQRSLSNMQIACLVLLGVNIKSEALLNRSMRSMGGTAAIAEVERLQALPKRTARIDYASIRE
jgi:hypothetical protein